MKKINLTLFIACIFAMSNCQKPKDWKCTCECKPIGGVSSTKKTTIENTKKRAASDLCADFGKAQVNGNGSWKCSITD